MYGVREALSHLNFLGNVHPGVELPVSTEKEQASTISKSPFPVHTWNPNTSSISLIITGILCATVLKDSYS